MTRVLDDARYYAKNREKVLARQAERRRAHPEVAQAYYRNNKEKYASSSAVFRKRHRVKLAAKAAVDRRARPEQSAARSAVSRAIREGLLTPEPCRKCGLRPKKVNGRNRIQAHHYLGYKREHWLDVQWYCGPHHWEEDHSAPERKDKP